jgi:hypothetical protein
MELGTIMIKVKANDWRTELYLQGVEAEPLGLKSNFYYTELSAEWPKQYDIIKESKETDGAGRPIYTGGFRDEYINNPGGLDYYLDFIDSAAAISEFNISNIGRRTKVESNDDINCIFEHSIEDVILIPAGRDITEELTLEAINKNQNYTLVDENIYTNLTGGGSQNSAYNAIRDLLYQYTNYNESVSIQMLPLFFLEPNIRIYLHDSESGIHGDYIINSISMPIDISGQMNLSCSKALERI